MIVRQIPVGPMMNMSYLIVCEKTRAAAVVDAAWESNTIGRALEQERGKLTYLLCTHGHDDHVNLVAEWLDRFPESTAVCHERERIPAPRSRTKLVKDSDLMTMGEIDIRCLHTPGHTPGSVTYIAGGHAFFGDTLFSGEDCGRVDFYREGPEEMALSLQKIRKLPDDLVVCSGHKYGAYDTTTLKFEKENNRALRCRTLEEFLEFKSF